MSHKSADNAFIFLLWTMMLLAFALGMDVGESLEKRRLCAAQAKAAPPMQPSLCRD